jgi:putative drug exporter of the RND superfamily
MLSRLVGFPTGRRGKWIVLAAWLLAAAALAPLQPRLQEVSENDPVAFLPGDAESRRALDTIETRFREGRVTPALVVWQRSTGLTSADRARIDAELARLRDEPLPGATPPAPLRVSEDGTTALSTVAITAQTVEEIEPVVERVREVTQTGDGLRSWVGGPAGITVDAVKVFEQIDGTLLLATTLLILALLLLLYRSPVIALVPLVVVAVSYVVAAAAVYGLAQLDLVAVNGQATGILIILMFGAGTDYCLLIVARAKEELRRTHDRHAALAEAVRHTTPAVLSSGGTVVAAMLVLLVADLDSTRSLGPVLAAGIAVTMLAGLTLLPALLAILGRRSYWPAIPRVGDGDPGGSRVWRRVGELVAHRPRAVAALVTAALALGALGNLQSLPPLGFGNGFRGEVEAVQAQEALARAFPAGEAATTDVLVRADAAPAAERALRGVDGVAAVTAAGRSDDGRLARLAVSFEGDPYEDAAVGAVAPLREAARSADAAALVGGPTAEEADTRAAVARDAKLIVPLTLLAILGILVLLLRAIVAPLYLVATVVLSFGTTLGLATLAFRHVFDSPGSDPGLPTLVFLFTVALGIDYNIFLIARVREEAGRLGSVPAVVVGLERTGGVITSAGLILAGTFSVLTVLPLEQLFQLGFAVALGVLVDTFVVRSLLVPAIAIRLGDRSWWPRRPHGEERVSVLAD